MRCSPLTVSLLDLVVVGVALTGCATGTTSTGDPTTTADPSVETTPTPTIEPIVVGPAEMPPVAFGGDCAKALTAEDIAEATGEQVAFERSGTGPVGDNVGALHCNWRADGMDVALTVLPRAGLDEAELTPEFEASYFDSCATAVCSWQGGDDVIWVELDFRADGALSRDTVDAWGAALGQHIIAQHESTGYTPWTRDRTGWWTEFDCATVADAVGAQLGEEITGAHEGYADAPSPWFVLAEQESRVTSCSLHRGDDLIGFSTSAGTGIDPFADFEWTAANLGVPGIEALVAVEEVWGSTYFALSDGINGVNLTGLPADARAQEFAVAVAAAAASDFQP